MDTEDKVRLLADASRYDLACACGTKDKDDHRQRTADGIWLYPVSLPDGGTSVMLKILVSNLCVNDCRYCPFRAGRDTPRCSLDPETVARICMEFIRRRAIFGVFLSSGVMRHPDHTMDRLNAVARLLRRRHGFRGFIHLKLIPGAADAAVDEALSLASAVSLNVEAPTAAAFGQLCTGKDYHRDVVRIVKRVSRLTAPEGPHARVKQTTQFVVGAADETDADLIDATARLYERWRLQRIYFSAYQRGLGEADLPGERELGLRPHDLLTREHRLYQCDWLLRKYGFSAGEIPLDAEGRLCLEEDPKTLWAQAHPERFPVDVNHASREELLRVPGFGPKTVAAVLAARHNGGRIFRLSDIGRPDKRLRRALPFVKFG